jgi:flagellar basal body-associated protein FliL
MDTYNFLNKDKKDEFISRARFIPIIIIALAVIAMIVFCACAVWASEHSDTEIVNAKAEIKELELGNKEAKKILLEQYGLDYDALLSAEKM